MSTISKPHTFSAGATIIASEHNSNFDTIYNDYNGNVTNVNIASGAGITDTKLAQITTASKVSGSALTSLSSIPSGAGEIPGANIAIHTLTNKTTPVDADELMLSDSADSNNKKALSMSDLSSYASVQSKVVTVDVTSTGSVAVTGVGFPPTSIIFTNSCEPSGSDSHGTALVDSSGDVRSTWFERKSDGATQANHSTSHIQTGSGGSFPAIWAATFTSHDSDGFTINVTTANSDGFSYALCQR